MVLKTNEPGQDPNTRTNLSIYYGGYQCRRGGKGSKREMGVNESECDALEVDGTPDAQ